MLDRTTMFAKRIATTSQFQLAPPWTIGAAFVVLLMWSFLAGLIYLYGAALTRAAGELRPARG